MRKKTFSRFLQGAVSMVMVASMLTGCGGSAASTSSSNASAETATTAADNVEYKDTLVVGEYGDSDSLDPQKNVSHDKIERELYEGLLEIDPDTGEFKGCLAESWEHSDDYMTWTFHLRKGVKFASSGKEMTSADVVATFDRLLDKEHPGRYYQNVEFIDTVTAPDDYTVVMTLAHAFGAVEDTLTQACTFILNKDYIDQYGDDMGFDPATIDGTGPYKLVSWDVDEQVVMEASENWWRGEAGTKNLIVKIIPEASSRAMAIETGEVDIIDRPGVDDVSRLENTDGLVVFKKPGYGIHGFQYNCSEGHVTSDTKVRQAIMYAIDKETICQALYGSIGETATHGLVAPQYFGYVDLGVQPYDPEKAKELLAEAGYPNGLDLQSGLVPCKNNGKKTRCYKIAKKDVAEYLYRRESDPMHYTPPSGWYYNYPKHKKPAASLERKLNYKGEERLLAKKWYEQQLANYPDVLTVAQVCEVTGYQRHTILKWCSKGLLKTILQTPKYMIPKVWLLEFVTSDFFNEISRKCGKHYAAIKEIGGSRKAR